MVFCQVEKEVEGMSSRRKTSSCTCKLRDALADPFILVLHGCRNPMAKAEEEQERGGGRRRRRKRRRRRRSKALAAEGKLRDAYADTFLLVLHGCRNPMAKVEKEQEGGASAAACHREGAPMEEVPTGQVSRQLGGMPKPAGLVAIKESDSEEEKTTLEPQ